MSNFKIAYTPEGVRAAHILAENNGNPDSWRQYVDFNGESGIGLGIMDSGRLVLAVAQAIQADCDSFDANTIATTHELLAQFIPEK